MRIATFNMESIFSRPRVMNSQKWSDGRDALAALADFTARIDKPIYSEADRAAMVEFLSTYASGKDRLFSLVEVRGRLYDSAKKVIKAEGRDGWGGSIEPIRDDILWATTLNTARVVDAVKADVLVCVEVEDRLTLNRFNTEVLASFGWSYEHCMLVDGNDERGIDIGLLSKFPIRSIRSHIDDADEKGRIFSRDCPEFEVEISDSQVLWVLGAHWKSKGYGSPAATTARRVRQAERTREILDQALTRSEFVVVAGDFNDIPTSEPIKVLTKASGVKDAMSLPAYVGTPGTYKTGNTLNQKIDYAFLSPSLQRVVHAVGVERRGIYAPSLPGRFAEVTGEIDQASDHGALWVDITL